MTAPLRALASAITTCLDAAKRALASANTADQQAKAAAKSALDAETQADTVRVVATTVSVNGAVASSAADVATTQAGVATGQATTATGQAAAAQSSAAASQTARLAAEAARDASNTIAKVFASTAAGIAGTTANQAFGVLSAATFELIVYRNLAGAANEDYRLKLSTFFDALFPQGFQASRSGYLHAWVDSAGRVLGGIKLDGTFWSKGVNISASLPQALSDSANAVATANIASNLTAAARAVVSQPRGGSVLHAWVDSANRILAYIGLDGTLWSKGVNVTSLASTIPAVLPAGPERSRWLSVFTDANSRILGGFLKNGELEVKGVNISASVAAVPAAVALAYPLKSTAIFGDSLTEGAGSTGGQTLGVQLQALYASTDARTVFSSGYGGQGAASILARFGPVPSLVTLPNGAAGFPELPAGGTVNVTVTNNPLSYADPTQAKSITGTLRGIPCVLTKAANTGQYSIARVSPGAAAVQMDPGQPFIPDTAIYQTYTLVCWIGTNDITGSMDTLFANIGNYLSWQTTTQKRRVVVMPAINCLSGSLATIQANYATLLGMVKAKYPTEYVDTLSLLQRNNNGSADDLADVAAGLPPRSLLFTDRYHLNSTGYGIVAAEIKRIFDAKGF